MSEPLSLWNPGPTRDAVLAFVERVTDPDTGLPPEERVAVFDNDGTLWCEKPMPIQLDFILRRLVAMVQEDPTLAEKQPWKAAAERDYGWFGTALAKHYAGDDTQLPALAGGILGGLRRHQRRRLRRAGRGVPARHVAPHPRPRLPRVRLRPDGAAARLPRGQRLHQLHRLRRRPRLHAADHRRGLRRAERAGHRQRHRAGVRARRATAARSSRRPRPTTSTTGPRSRCASGTGSAGARCSPAATPTATSRCSTGPGIRPCRSLRLLVLHDDAEREFDYVAGSERALELAAARRLDRASSRPRTTWATVF